MTIEGKWEQYLQENSLKRLFGHKPVVMQELQKVYLAGEKENAELKEKLEIEQNARSDWFGKAVTKDRQLTKAKEHIENLLYYVKQCTCERSNYTEIGKDIKEAEQFLSEVEK